MKFIAFLSLLVLGFNASPAAPSPKSLIIFSDIKLDDKLAIALSLGKQCYTNVVVILSEITKFQQASEDLVDFLAKSSFTTPSDVEKLIILEGNPKSKAAPHEINFIASPRPKLVSGKFSEILSFLPSQSPIDILQIAPNPYANLKVLSEQYSVENYHLIHGYNSKQAASSSQTETQAQLEFLTGISQTIGIKAKFTNNFASFVPAGSGSSQKYTDLTSILPTEHLQAAARDPFHANKLREVRDAFRKAGKAVLELIPEGYTESTLEEAVLNARMNLPSTDGPELRLHFIGWINSVLPHLEMLNTISETDRFRFKNVLPKAFTGDFSIELCDANHLVLVSAAEDQGFSEMSFVVANAGTPKETILFTAVDAEHPIHGVTLHGLSAKLALEEIKKSLKL